MSVRADPVANIRISDQTDFPTLLGNLGSQEQAAPNFGWGRGKAKVSAPPAGRGSGSAPGQSSYDEDFPGPGASSSRGAMGSFF